MEYRQSSLTIENEPKDAIKPGLFISSVIKGDMEWEKERRIKEDIIVGGVTLTSQMKGLAAKVTLFIYVKYVKVRVLIKGKIEMKSK